MSNMPKVWGEEEEEGIWQVMTQKYRTNSLGYSVYSPSWSLHSHWTKRQWYL